jgi:two-component system chemotaxis response regulator CheB
MGKDRSYCFWAVRRARLNCCSRWLKHFPHDLIKRLSLIHSKKNFFSEIEKLFAENSRMLLREISDKDPIDGNTIYIAPANYHTLIEKRVFLS